MKKVFNIFLVFVCAGLLGALIADDAAALKCNNRDFLSCEFTCLPGRDGWKTASTLTVVNQDDRREGCIDVLLWNASGHSPIGFRIKLTHYDLDKVNICKMLYEAKKAGLIDEIPLTGALQVRMPNSYVNAVLFGISFADLTSANLAVNAWTTEYTTARYFYYRESEMNEVSIGSTSKANCEMVTRQGEYDDAPFAYPSPDHWVQPVFIQGSGGPGDEQCNEEQLTPR